MSRVWWRALARQVLDATFPPRCAGCGERAQWLCPACLRRIEQLPLPQCAGCDTPVGPAERHRCPRRGPLGVVCAGGIYAGPLREAIHALKYQGRHGIGTTLAGLLAPSLRACAAGGDVLVPVPLHPQRERERGYNQARVLAVELADLLAWPVADDLLRRIRPTAQQTRMNGRDERRANVEGAFAATGGNLPGGRVWLVDDVYTTGATLAAAAQALRAAGVREINGAVIARARGGA
jgi:ComF family protein